MPNHTSKISLALSRAGLPLQLRTAHGDVTVSGPDLDGLYAVSGLPGSYASLDMALRDAAGRLASMRPLVVSLPA